MRRTSVMRQRRNEVIWAAGRLCKCEAGGCGKCLNALRAAVHNLHIEQQKVSKSSGGRQLAKPRFSCDGNTRQQACSGKSKR